MADKKRLTKEIVKALCKRELFHEATDMVRYILDAEDEDAPFSIDTTYTDEIEKLEAKLEQLEQEEPPEYNYDKWLEWQTEWAEIETELEVARNSLKYGVMLISEWWLCTEWMGQQLEKHGETVIFTEGFAIWGREFYGTDPCNDPVFETIANDIEILPNQKYDWSKYIKESK